jgi:hypothetical protein
LLLLVVKMSVKKLLLPLLFIAIASCIEFQQFEGKIADPCNKYLDPIVRKDCALDSQWPAATNTILIPSSLSTSSTTPPVPIGPTGATGLYTQSLSIKGQFPFVPNGATVTWALGLATSEDTCRKIDFNYRIILLTPPSATTPPTVGPNSMAANQLTFTLGTASPIVGSLYWDDISLEIEDRPRLLCFTTVWDPVTYPIATNTQGSPYWVYTGFKIGVVRNCDGACGDVQISGLSGLLTPLQLELRRQRTVCCKRDTILTGAKINAGQCINPNVQTCCGASQVELAQEKCCNPTWEVVSQIDNLCPCSQQTDCPAGERCCVPNKYPQLSATAGQLDLYTFTNPDGTTIGQNPTNWLANGVWPFYRGQCYRPTQYHCCDTGAVFDPGSQQCCRINGIQSINVPCPCLADSDCVTQHFPPESRTYNFTCCAQTAVTPIESSAGTLGCNIYANYPSGQGAPEIQRCSGVCIDPRFQFCCNGEVCMARYERCCNSTCCNIWTSTCFYALRPGAKGSRNNWFNWAQGQFATVEEIYEQCSSSEHLTTTKSFWIFVLPAMLLLASHLGLALVLVFAAKATPRTFSKLEIMMMLLALAISYLAMPLYFAPVWKYGIWIIFAQLVVFLTATARIHWLNVLCLVVQFITLVYVFDPFHGNAYLTLSNYRIWGNPNAAGDDVMSSGLLHSITKSWHTNVLTDTQQWCTNFYDYFLLDPTLRDVERYDNSAISTFGYCSRGWSTALMIFSFFLMTGLLIQIILVLLGLFFRFHSDSIFEEGYYETTESPEAEQYIYQ